MEKQVLSYRHDTVHQNIMRNFRSLVRISTGPFIHIFRDYFTDTRAMIALMQMR